MSSKFNHLADRRSGHVATGGSLKVSAEYTNKAGCPLVGVSLLLLQATPFGKEVIYHGI